MTRPVKVMAVKGYDRKGTLAWRGRYWLELGVHRWKTVREADGTMTAFASQGEAFKAARAIALALV